MTRINAGIHPKKLSDKHLLAEHREIKRIPNHLKKFGDRCLSNAPTLFKLGKGHVLFFISKGKYTLKRYLQIFAECKRRGFNVQNFKSAWDIYDKFSYLFDDWIPEEHEIQLVKQRIEERGGTS